MQRPISLGITVFLIACGQTPPGAPQQTSPQPLQKHAQTQLTRTEGDYEATLLLIEKRGIINLRVSSRRDADTTKLPITRRLELFRPLLEQALRERGRRTGYLLTVGEYPELNMRLGDAAACSEKWNSTTGTARSGDPGTAAKDLLAEARAYRELEPLFESLGYRIAVESVESVVLCRGNEIQPQSCRKIQPNSKLPCGASILFRLTAKE